MKKLISAVTALTMLIGFTGCSNGRSESSSPTANLTAEKLGNAAYKRSLVTLEHGMNIIYMMRPISGGEKLMLFGMGGSGLCAAVCDADMESCNAVELPEMKYGTSYNVDAADDGSLIQIVNMVDYGDLPEPDTNSPDYDEKLYDDAAQYSLLVNRFDTDGKLVSSNEIDSSAAIAGKYTNIRTVIAGKDAVIAEIDNDFCLISYSGKLISKLSGSTVKSFGKNKSGELICLCVPEEGKLQIRTIDENSGNIAESSLSYDFTEGIKGNIYAGNGAYSLFFASFSTIYGIMDDGSIEPVFSFNAADLNPNNFTQYNIRTDGSVVFLDTDYESYMTKLRLFTPCDPSEIPEVEVITLGRNSRIDYMLDDYIKSFNDSQDAVHIEVKSFEEGDFGELTEFGSALSTGELPDIIRLEDVNDSPFCRTTFEEYGCLCDMYEFIDNDPDFCRDDFVPNAIKFCEKDGKLSALPNIFEIEGGYLTKASHKDDLGDWTPADRLKFYQDPPSWLQPDKYPNDSKMTRILNLFDVDDYIDAENGTCHFDDQLFIDILKYADGGNDEETIYSGLPDAEQDAHTEYSNLRLRNDVDAVIDFHLSSYDGYVLYTRGLFGTDDVVHIGEKPYICFSNGYYAISETCKNKELAWEFLRYVYTDKFIEEFYKGGRCSWGGLPITKSGLKVRQEYDKTPFNQRPKYIYGANFEYFDLGDLTQEDIDRVNAIIDSTDTFVASGRAYNHKLPIPITEELIWSQIKEFFAGGCTAERCAELIQNRVSLYLAEQK